MKGPYPLSTTTIREELDGGDTGVFALKKSRDGPIRFVGKSTDLARRLREHADEYRYFAYETQPNTTQAYQREANLFHHHGGTEDLDNPRHPARPHKQVTCPRCSIHK